ncbi:hypothetical protein ASG17_02620 [Brevundimonas sp. Leaf363]|nr:hypothetical protein ASG17_02620 [Brevundimonas sp. Leaf363]
MKGIDPKAREIAKDLARRSGMTLGEWLNSMIMEDGDEEELFTPLSRRTHAADAFDRRGRTRRLDDAYAGGGDDTLQRVAASVEAIAARLEAAERRSTVAITGVDQAVSGLVRQLEARDTAAAKSDKRISDIADELREGHRRLRKLEQETGPETAEAFGKVETAVGTLASRLYDIEERQRTNINELRLRLDAAEKGAGTTNAGEVLSQVGARLDAAQGRTTDALRRLEQSFAGLDQRLRTAEGRIEPEGAREAARFEKLAEVLSRQVEASRTEMLHRLETAEAEGRLERVERALVSVGDQVKAAEERSARGIDAMGREVLRIAQNLNGRMEQVEANGAERIERLGQTLSQTLGQTLSQQVERDMTRYAQVVEQRLITADDRHALALEKLGGEITRISDRLSDRISQSERKSAQALEDIGRRLAESADRTEQRYDRASGELAERMRLSEERTARLLAEARESIEQRPARPEPAPAPVEAPIEAPAAHVASEPAQAEIIPDFAQPDWRAAAFAGAAEPAAEPADDLWVADPAPFPSSVFAAAAAPEPVIYAPEPAPEPEPATVESWSEPVHAFGAFGGARVDDALEATAPEAAPFGAPNLSAQAFGSSAPTAPTFSDFDAGDSGYAAETEFVDQNALRAAAAAGRAASTRSAIDAARAAMAEPADAPAPQAAFGRSKKGGKSRLQERLDQQANRDGSTIRKALVASAVSAAIIGGGYGYVRLSDGAGIPLPGADQPTDAAPIAALALTATDATPSSSEDAAALFAEAGEKISADKPGGVETLRRAADMGYAPAQLQLAGLYQTGEHGVATDTGESRLWVRRAAEGGDAQGMHAYGMYLFDGVGGGRNRAEALDWLKRAAEKGLVDSQYNVARLYENGDEGIAKNPSEALKWYTVAARAGDQQAQAAVNRLTPAATAEARRAARKAADAFQAQAAG